MTRTCSAQSQSAAPFVNRLRTTLAMAVGSGLCLTTAIAGVADVSSAPLSAVNPDAALYQQLPAGVRKAGVLRFVGEPHPPYRIVSDDRKIRDGIEADMARAFEQILGVPIEHNVVASLPATLGGLEAGRYDVALGPAVASRERLMRFDSVSWIFTKPSFVYPTSRPHRYQRFEDLCGKKIAYVAGSVSERVTAKVIALCVQDGLAAAEHVPLVDSHMTLIATQAGRADLAAMTLSAAMHVAHENGQRFKVFSDDTNKLGIDLMSLFVTKRSGLAPVMLAALETSMQSGAYQRVMNKWGVLAVSVDTPRMNASK